MNGGVRVYSKPNLGTCFSAIIQADSLPISARNLQSKLQINSQNPNTSLQQRRVLIADDDPFNLELHVTIIRELGFNLIDTANDGEDLLKKFKSKPERYFDIIITDVAMPRMNGIEAAVKIREFEEAQRRGRNVKIGFITGHSNIKDKEICENHQIQAHFYLPKPINPLMLESFLDLKGSSPLLTKLRTSSASIRKKTLDIQFLL